MQRLTLFVSGKVQRIGYGDKVVEMGRSLNLQGYVENHHDGMNRFFEPIPIVNLLFVPYLILLIRILCISMIITFPLKSSSDSSLNLSIR